MMQEMVERDINEGERVINETNGDDIEAYQSRNQEYRDLTEKIEAAKTEPEKGHHGLLSYSLKLANRLFKHVRNPFEASMDSKLLKMTSELGQQAAKRIKLEDNCIDPELFVAKLKDFKYEKNDALVKQMDIETIPTSYHLSNLAKCYWDKAPSVNVLGMLGLARRVTRKMARRKELGLNKRAAVQSEQVDHKDLAKNGSSTVNEAKDIYILLQKYGEISLFEFALNPMSFGQSVENLFYISFLIKEGKAKLELNEDTNILMLSATSAPTKDDYQNGLKKKQIIMELDYQSWEGLIAFFNIKKSIIPDRQAYNSNEMATSYIVE